MVRPCPAKLLERVQDSEITRTSQDFRICNSSKHAEIVGTRVRVRSMIRSRDEALPIFFCSASVFGNGTSLS